MEPKCWTILASQARRAIAVCAAVFLFSSCATGYHPLDHGTGYSDSQVAPDEFRVSFRGNGNTSPQKADDFVLLRAAQVTRQHGFPWFAVLDVTNTSSVRPYTSQFRYYAAPLPSPYSPYGSGADFVGSYVTSERHGVYVRPGSTLLIKGYATKPEKPFTYDAKALEQSLGAKYHLQKPVAR